MKKFRMLFLTVSAALAISLVAVLAGCSATATSSGSGGSSSSAATSGGSSKSSATESKAKNYITKADYDKIQNGMSYADVKGVIGCDGEQMSEVGTKGDSLYTVVYDWKGKDGISNAVLEFQGDQLQMKSQTGLQ